MATVYEVEDLSTARRLALKQLQQFDDPRKQRKTRELFEREFYTLSQLAHPRIVEVFDYGVDDSGPYYTMELLDGGDLQQWAPLPWLRACALARDICSALSLVHSRRLVYRDLNPRNVRCTSTGVAKLIDFGALADMGPSKHVIGTPAYCAPEAVDFQPIDARTDLYSLGATLYFMLTGRHAYPAKSFDELRSLLLSGRPQRIAKLVADVPAALEALVSELMQPDAALRPANAAEIVEQLAVVEGRTFHELPQVTQAYLSTPTLVGRSAQLARVRSKIGRLQTGRGSSVLIDGPSGVGRSRMLTACLLETKLAGAMGLRADASDSRDDYAVWDGLCAQLLEADPELTQRAAVAAGRGWLLHALPRLSTGDASERNLEADPNRLRGAVINALRDWVLAVAKQRPLVIAVDDLHAIDEPSVAALALLSREAGDHNFAIIGTTETGAAALAPAALKLLAEGSLQVRLENWTAIHTEKLLRSVFGDVPHVQALAHKLHAITSGNPRDLMQLSQYLVDKQLAFYRAGSWALPVAIDATDLPSSMANALATRVQALGAAARELAQGLALSPDRGISFEECAALCRELDSGSVMSALDELRRAQIVTRQADSYAIAQRGLVAVIQAELPAMARGELHRDLAEIFRKRGTEEFRRTQHLLRAGQEREALDVMVAFAAASQARTDSSPHEYIQLVRSLPDDWLDAYLTCVQLADALQRPKRDAYVLRRRLCGLLNVMRVPSAISYPVMRAMFEQLNSLTCLDELTALDPALPAPQRVPVLLGRARHRYEQSSEFDRVVDPGAALSELVRVMVVAAGMASIALDHALWRSSPDLAPFSKLSVGIECSVLLREGIGARLSGHYERAIDFYQRVLTLTDREDRAGLDHSNHRYLRYGVMGALGLMQAPLGLAASLDWASQVEDEPLYVLQTMQIRLLYYLWRGQLRAADKFAEQIELVRIHSAPFQIVEGPYLVARLVGNAACEDLTRIKHTLDEVREFALRHTAWQPVHDYGVAEFHRIRGDHQAALAQLNAALEATEVGQHQIWPHVAGARVRVLCALGDYKAARQHGEADLARAEAAGLGYVGDFIKLPLAVALASSGDIERATQLADAGLSRCDALGVEGVLRVLSHETRARVALAVGDTSTLRRQTALCAQHGAGTDGRMLGAIYARLKAAARSLQHGTSLAPPKPGLDAFSQIGASHLTSLLQGSATPPQRALELLLQRCGARQGFLYVVGTRGLNLAARVGTSEPSDELTAFAQEYLDGQLREDELLTLTQFSYASSISADPRLAHNDNGARHHPILLMHQGDDGAVVAGMALVLLAHNQRFEYPAALAAEISRAMEAELDAKPFLTRH